MTEPAEQAAAPWWRPAWWWAPFIGIGAVVCVNMILLRVAGQVTTDSVEIDPFANAHTFDAERQAIQRFRDAGLELVEVRLDTGPGLQITGERAGELSLVQLRWYRPADEHLDTTETWANPTQQRPVTVSAPGLWHCTLIGQLGGEPVRQKLTVIR